MRRRTVLIGLASTTLAVLPATAAHAETTTSGLPGWLSYTPVACTVSDTAGGTYTHVTGPVVNSTSPLNNGSLELLQPSGTSGYLDDQFASFTPGPPSTGDPVGDLSTLTVRSYRPAGGATGRLMLYAVTNNMTGAYDQLTATLPTTAAWNTTDFRTVGLHVVHYDPGTNSFSDGGDTTWTSYAAGHSSALLGDVSLLVDGCNEAGDTSFYVDDLEVDENGNATSADFEPGVAPSLTVSAPTSAVSGTAVKVGTVMKSNSVAVAADEVTLWAKPAGTGAYTQVGTATTNASGVATSTQHPTVTTTYQWRFAGDPANAPSQSATKTVKVATRLTLHVADSTLPKTQPLVSWGAESPARTGATVTVRRQVSGPDVKLGTAKVGSDGTWSFQKSLGKGTYRIYATVPATTTNIAGTSATVTVSVG